MPRIQLAGKDARNKTVRVHDRVMDKKGEIYKVLRTDKSLLKKGIIRAGPLHQIASFILLKLDRVFKVKKTTENGSRRLYTRLWNTYAKPLRRKARRKKRKVEEMPMKLCPVCRDEPNAIRFKLGIPVWNGKKLHVCTKRCAAVIRKEIRIAVQNGVDKETARRRAAYKYMKKGGQL